MIRLVLSIFLLVVASSGAAIAQQCDTPSGQPVPRFVTLSKSEAYGRAGPSLDHPVMWVYERVGLPMEVIAEMTDWRKVRDPDGEEVWMHKILLSGRRAFWALEQTTLYSRHDTSSAEIALIEPGAVLTPDRCRTGWCRIEAQGLRGWVELDRLWGVDGTEVGDPPALEGANNACYRSQPN
jgi:SH3-like domain-containing protein